VKNDHNGANSTNDEKMQNVQGFQSDGRSIVGHEQAQDD
jgi:hypothetical protein